MSFTWSCYPPHFGPSAQYGSYGCGSKSGYLGETPEMISMTYQASQPKRVYIGLQFFLYPHSQKLAMCRTEDHRPSCFFLTDACCGRSFSDDQICCGLCLFAVELSHQVEASPLRREGASRVGREGPVGSTGSNSSPGPGVWSEKPPTRLGFGKR